MVVVVVLNTGFVEDLGEEDSGTGVAHFAVHVGGCSPEGAGVGEGFGGWV